MQLITGAGSANMSHLQNCSVKIFKEQCRYFTKKRKEQYRIQNYIKKEWWWWGGGVLKDKMKINIEKENKNIVSQVGFEPTTFGLENLHSNPLD